MDEIEDKRKAGKIGGARRAEILSPERRAEIAREAAIKRWGDRLPRATHKGNFKKEFGIDVECYVLDDRAKTAVISQTGMARALGLPSTGGAFPRFLAGKAMALSAGAELLQKIRNPIKFQTIRSGAERVPRMVVHGFDAALLIDICNAIIALESRGKLYQRHQKVAAQAHIILGASAKAGIRQLVYALAGYNPTAEEVIAAFKSYVQEEARKYEQEFPNELYLQWHRLYAIPVPVRGKPWQFKHLTIKHIYFPLAKSSGKVLELLRALKASDGDRQKKLFQFLNEVGARVLRIHIGRVLEMAESSADRQAYEKRIVERFGGQQELDLIVPPPPASELPLPQYDEAAN
jgi:P63C domain